MFLGVPEKAFFRETHRLLRAIHGALKMRCILGCVKNRPYVPKNLSWGVFFGVNLIHSFLCCSLSSGEDCLLCF